jgi:D-serine deaminase-like pyridoxal phosphate-dependent protein
MLEDLATPCIVVSAPLVRKNLQRMADYARSHGIGLRPHTKTHKSTKLAAMQMELGAVGLTVAKVGEARIMAKAADDLLLAYPTVDKTRSAAVAELAREKTMRVGLDSTLAADVLNDAAARARSTVGVLIDFDAGNHRTGVQNAAEALSLAQHISQCKSLRLDGLMFYPGHLQILPADQAKGLTAIEAKINEIVDLWRRHGLEAKIISGGSTPTAMQSHQLRGVTEIRPGTYIYNDMSYVRCGCAAVEDCAARVLSTVVSATISGQIVLDAGSKTMSSDRSSYAPESGYGHLVGFPEAVVTKLSEEHAQVDVSRCPGPPKLGQRVELIPNHICPAINLQDGLWWFSEGFEQKAPPERLPIEARGQII